LSHTAATWQNFAEQVLLDSDPECRLGKILAMDLPGHGGSSLPWSTSGIKFGDLTLQDYAQTLISTVDRLKASRLPVNILLAHSMGGVITQLAQNKLLLQKSSFKRKGIESVVLLASSLPKPLAWNLADSGAGAQLAAPYIKQNIDLGGYAEIPAPNWLGLFFTNFTQQFVLGTPSLSEVQGRGYVALESLTAAGQLLRIQGFPPPQVDQGLFVRQHGTRLVVIAFAQDITVTVDEQKNLYRFLTADADLQSFKTVTGDQAVHDTYISNPRLLFSALQ
jgi:pimeloyl-ACP methyl ester carboxylesterase